MPVPLPMHLPEKVIYSFHSSFIILLPHSAFLIYHFSFIISLPPFPLPIISHILHNSYSKSMEINMLEYIHTFIEHVDAESFFWFCALAGSGMMVIQFILNLCGLGEGQDTEDGQDSDSGKFKWMSRQAVTGFMMMFGWTALTCKKEFGIEGFIGLTIAATAGIITVFVTGYISS